MTQLMLSYADFHCSALAKNDPADRCHRIVGRDAGFIEIDKLHQLDFLARLAGRSSDGVTVTSGIQGSITQYRKAAGV